ncbi:MAG: A24 family peptidase [Chloroflexota bacterium]
MTPGALAVGIGFAALGAAAERLATVWPQDEASHRSPGARTVLLALAAGLAGGAVTWRANLPPLVLAVHLVILGILVLLTATDLEQRRLPHLLLDPLIVVAIAFVPFNPAVSWQDALIGGGAAVAFLGLLGLLVRGGVARGDLLLIAPLGLIVGWPAIFIAMFLAGLLSAVVSVGLLATGRAGLQSYIPFGPFLVAGLVITLLREPGLLGPIASLMSTFVRT